MNSDDYEGFAVRALKRNSFYEVAETLILSSLLVMDGRNAQER